MNEQQTNVYFPSFVPDIRTALFEGSETQLACLSDGGITIKMTVEQCMNDTDSGELKHLEKNLSQCDCFKDEK
jgi:hypothetical protein